MKACIKPREKESMKIENIINMYLITHCTDAIIANYIHCTNRKYIVYSHLKTTCKIETHSKNTILLVSNRYLT